jgi:hypothetical protein
MSNKRHLNFGLHVSARTVCVAHSEVEGKLTLEVEPSLMSLVSEEVLYGTPYADQGIRYNGRVMLLGSAALKASRDIAPVNEALRTCGRMDIHDPAAEFALSKILGSLLGEPLTPTQKCVFAVPAPDVKAEASYQFHIAVLKDIIRKLGYSAFPVEEGRAAALAVQGNIDESLLAFSVGHRIVHGCLSSRAVFNVAFSREPGGERIDRQLMSLFGKDREEIDRLREKCECVFIPKNREEEALLTFSKEFLDELLSDLSRYFNARGLPHLPDPIDVVWTGVRQSPKGMGDLLLRRASALKFPITLRRVLTYKNPTTAVAEGCSAAAGMLESDDALLGQEPG